eukprot:9190485-Lingulodinium_polyedra.AAC.1
MPTTSHPCLSTWRRARVAQARRVRGQIGFPRDEAREEHVCRRHCQPDVPGQLRLPQDLVSGRDVKRLRGSSTLVIA